MKRGQSLVVPFFRGGEGDGTLNGFVLSTLKDHFNNAVILHQRTNSVNLSPNMYPMVKKNDMNPKSYSRLAKKLYNYPSYEQQQ